MGTITTVGTEIYYKDRGSGQPIVFSHGWPLQPMIGCQMLLPATRLSGHRP